MRESSSDSLKIAYSGDIESQDSSTEANGALLPSLLDSQTFARSQNTNLKETAVTQAQAQAGADVVQTADAVSLRVAGKGDEPACRVSSTYNTLIEKAYRNMFDPAPLGDLDSLLNKHNCQIKNAEDAFKFANEELARSGDHFTKVLNPEQVKKLDQLLKGANRGVGIEVTPVEPEAAKVSGSLRVREVIAGSSAERQGLHRGDFITSIDGVDIRKTTPQQAHKLLSEDKPHNLTVLRDGKPLEFNLLRRTVDMPAVADKLIPGTNIAYIRVRDFMQDDQSYELQNAIKRYPLAEGFIFDVRGNAGGAVDQALQSASMVVGKGQLLSEKVRSQDDNPTGSPNYAHNEFVLDQWELVHREILPNGEYRDKQRYLRLPDIVDKPSVVLVDGETASAAEIFTAALQQNGEATVIGAQTFGKGIGQTVFYNQPEGSRLQVTNFRFYTPNGEWIGDAGSNRTGIKPDEVVPTNQYAVPESEQDKQFQAAIAAINKKLGK